MKTMKVAKGSTRAQRRATGGRDRMTPPSAQAQGAELVAQKRTNRKLGVKLYQKAGAGIA